MNIMDIGPIDKYVATGVIYAAEDLGMHANPRLIDAIQGNNPATAIKKQLGFGDPLAYVITIVSNEFKNGQNSPVLKILDKNVKVHIGDYTHDIFYYVEKKREISQNPNSTDGIDEILEMNLIEFPSIQEMADIILLTSGLYPILHKRFLEKYNSSELEDKTSRYYGQEAIDRKRINGTSDGVIEALERVSLNIIEYIVILQTVAHNQFNQQILDQALFEERRKEVKNMHQEN